MKYDFNKMAVRKRDQLVDSLLDHTKINNSFMLLYTDQGHSYWWSIALNGHTEESKQHIKDMIRQWDMEHGCPLDKHSTVLRGDIVKCLDEESDNYLTRGQFYEIIKTDNKPRSVFILDDIGSFRFRPRMHFCLVSGKICEQLKPLDPKFVETASKEWKSHPSISAGHQSFFTLFAEALRAGPYLTNQSSMVHEITKPVEKEEAMSSERKVVKATKVCSSEDKCNDRFNVMYSDGDVNTKIRRKDLPSRWSSPKRYWAGQIAKWSLLKPLQFFVWNPVKWLAIEGSLAARASALIFGVANVVNKEATWSFVGSVVEMFK